MLNSKSQAGATANSSTKDDVIPSSPTCTKPLVVCSGFCQTIIIK